MNNKRDKNPQDDMWQQTIQKLMDGYSRLRLSNEDEETIVKIADKL